MERARCRVAAPRPCHTAHMVVTEWTRNTSGMVRFLVGVDAEAVAAGADPRRLAAEVIRSHEGDLACLFGDRG